MFPPQLKLMEISLLPRLVVERIALSPGTERIASSTGTVTSIAIRSAGRSPASKLTTTRGKSTWGNKATGSFKAAAKPPIASSTTKVSAALRCFFIHPLKFMEF